MSADTVYLLDASNTIEREILTNWVRSESTSTSTSTSIVPVASDRDRDGGDVPQQLSTALSKDGSTIVIPARVVWSPAGGLDRSHPRIRDLVLGDPRRPGPFMARAIHRRHPDRAACLAGDSATLGELRARFDATHTHDQGDEPFESFVLRQAGITLEVAERRLAGRRYKVPRFVVKGIESSSKFKQAVQDLGTELGSTPTALGAEARKYLQELVATPSTFFIDWSGALTRRIISLSYGEVVTDPENVARTRELVRDHPSALLWTHKSHVDGIALLAVLYANDFPAPHSFGGKNMAFGPMGFLGRRSGIIYIRRTFADKPVYKLALQQYLGHLMEKRFPFSWAFEGTRSRSGKLMPPRYGLLKYVVDAAHATGTEDLHLIPVAINYDLIGEATEYAGEEVGATKQTESVSWFVKYVRGLRAPMGNMYLDFGEPVVFEGKAPRSDQAELSRAAFEVARRVNEKVPVTLPSLMCMALLGAAPQALTLAELELEIQELIGWLYKRDIRMASSLERGELDRLNALAAITFERGLIHRFDDGPEPVLTIDDDQHPVASYYRNSIIHYFINQAIAEVALSGIADGSPEEREDQFWRDCHEVRDLMTFEFFHTPRSSFDSEIDAELMRHDPHWREVFAGGPDDVAALLGRIRPLVSHAVLQPFIEAYGVVAHLMAGMDTSASISENECVDQSLAMAEQYYLQRRLSTRASIGKLMFKGAYSLLVDRGLLDPQGADVSVERSALAATFDDLAGRLRRIRELALNELSGAAGTTGQADTSPL